MNTRCIKAAPGQALCRYHRAGEAGRVDPGHPWLSGWADSSSGTAIGSCALLAAWRVAQYGKGRVDLDTALWTIPAMRMKRGIDGKTNGDPHLVPLPVQAVAILRKLHPLTGHGALVFHGERSHDQPISDNTLRAALLTPGYGPDVQSVHGLRATARTLLGEELSIDPLVIEAQLARAVKASKLF